MQEKPMTEVIENMNKQLRKHDVVLTEEEEAVVQKKYNQLTTEFCVNATEAYQILAKDILTKRGISAVTTQNNDSEVVPIKDLVNREWVNITAKAVSIGDIPSDKIAQSGVLADATGCVKYIMWAKGNPTPLEVGKTYNIQSCVVDEYQGALNIKIAKNSTITPVEVPIDVTSEVVNLKDCAPGVMPTIKVKVTRLFDNTNPKIKQVGVIGDTTATGKFVIWASDEDIPMLEENQTYEITFAELSLYQGQNNIGLAHATIKPITETIDVASPEQTLTGLVAVVQEGSGVIKRCPVEGCNRTLTRRGMCAQHMMQTGGIPDLRIKFVLDTGLKALNCVANKEVSEKLLGVTMEDLENQALLDPLGNDAVMYDIAKRLTGRYVVVSGLVFPDSMVARNVEFATITPEDAAELAHLMMNDCVLAHETTATEQSPNTTSPEAV